MRRSRCLDPGDSKMPSQVFLPVIRRMLVVTLVVALAFFGRVSWQAPAHAQADIDIKGSRDPATIKSQLRMARQFGDKTLKALREELPEPSGHFTPETVHTAKLTYAYIRAAKGGIEIALSMQRFPDPVLGLTHKKVEEAWNLARPAASKITWDLSRQDFLAEAVPSLTRSMRLVDQALILMP